MATSINKCCGLNPTLWVPMVGEDDKPIDPELKPSIECKVCGTQLFHKDQKEVIKDWNRRLSNEQRKETTQPTKASRQAS